MYTRMKVPDGVCAIQEETSSLKPNPVENFGDVHEPMSYVRVVRRYGSA